MIKRMEPLTEENAKLKEAMVLMEKNVQRAQRERDLAKSNTRDLEYQKGALSEQLERSSEQLRSIFEQKKLLRIDALVLYCRTTYFADDRHFCRARCGARPVASGH